MGSEIELIQRLRAEAEKQRQFRGDTLYHGSPDPWLIEAAEMIEAKSTRIKELEEALRRIDAMRPVTCDMSLAHEMADIATEALEAKDSAARASQLLPTDSGRG
jgi:hypothetical protein